MNHTSRITTTPIQGHPARDPYARLAEEIIYRAKHDYEQPHCYNRDEIIEFFASGWYECLLDYITVCIPDFDPDEYILPDGIVM